MTKREAKIAEKEAIKAAVAKYGKLKHRREFKMGDFLFTVINTLIMLLVVVIMIYPFWNTIAVSFNDGLDSLKGGITLWPRKFSTHSYEEVFNNELLPTAILNSVSRTLIATILGVIVASIIGFVLSRKEFVWRGFTIRFFLFTMYISAGLIPTYMLIKNLGLLNNYLVYILPGMVSVFNVIIIKSYIEQLPESLVEAAQVDGAGYFRCYWQIVLPCCTPVLATVALWCAVGAWNSWFDTFLYCSSESKLTTLQYEMMRKLSAAMNAAAKRDPNELANGGSSDLVTSASLRCAITVVASVPILVVYPFLQRYFVKGVTLGAVKG